MATLKEFEAKNTYRMDDKGYQAFETFGRRVGGSYNAAGNDLRDIGRAKSSAMQMIGRWPFNIIELQKRESERAAALAQQGRYGPSGGVNVRGGAGGSLTDQQFAPRRMPNLAALNQMAEGAGAFGGFVNGYVGGGGRNDYRGPYDPMQHGETSSDRDGYSAQVLRERDRQMRLDQLAAEKRWEEYEKSLDKYNEKIETDAQKAVENQGQEYGGIGRELDTTGNYKYEPDTSAGEYGGSDYSWYNPAGWF
jgi:hypothetical protein